MSREAMKQALEALEFEASGWEDVPPITRDAITTLREALETEQKPVISTDHGPWIPSTHPGEEGETYCKRCLLRDKFFGSRQCDPHIVFRDPPQRKPLTDEEIEDLYFDKFSMGELKAFARAIEAAHGIGEKE